MTSSYILSRHPRVTSKDGEDICRRCSMYRLETVLWPCPAAKEVTDMAAEIEQLRAAFLHLPGIGKHRMM